MSIQVQCTQCGHTLKAPDTAAGKKGKCPKCGATVQVPAPAPDPIYDAEVIDPPMDPSFYDSPEPTYGVEGGEPAMAAAPEDNRRPCPMCGERISPTAMKCRFCGEVFDPALKKSQRRRAVATGSADLGVLEWLVAILCSGIGCIVGIVWMITGNPKGKKMFLVSVVFMIIWAAVRVMIETAAELN